ncbi:MAG: MBL fold metallo-hydrolase [Actinomycetota bacterium]|nr:MBL fold metallo-hydrolase [Actinomycetota bacterium]
MNVNEIAPRLWWWTTPHPEWTPAALKDGRGWQQDVSSYALGAEDAFVLFDPLLPEDDEAAFWGALDGDVEHHGPPAILITIFWHVRSSQAILDRYEGATLWAHEPAAKWVAERVRYTNTFTPGDRLPGGVEALPMHHMDEVAYWLPAHGSMVVGDTMLGYDGVARLCPASWLRKEESYDEVRRCVQRVLDYPANRLLLTHGGPTDPNAVEV